jgi:hypothetical protein
MRLKMFSLSKLVVKCSMATIGLAEVVTLPIVGQKMIDTPKNNFTNVFLGFLFGPYALVCTLAFVIGIILAIEEIFQAWR